MRAWMTMAVLAVFLGGCPGDDDAPSMGGAAKEFLTFAKTGDKAERPDAVKKVPMPAIEVAEREVVEGARSRVELTLELPMTVAEEPLRAVMEAAARGPEGRGHVVVRVRAYPGKLRHVVGPFGTMVVARDGKGLDGTQPVGTHVEVAKKLGASLSIDETRAVGALDRAFGEGKDEKAAVAAAAGATGLDEDDVEDALEKVRERFPPPR